MAAFAPRAGVRRGFLRLSDRLGGAALSPRVFLAPAGTSGTFVCPADGVYIITCWGGGGQGARGGDSTPLIGGSTGAICRKKITLKAGDAINYVAGFGEATRNGTYNAGVSSYQPATASTVNGPGFSMYAGPSPKRTDDPRVAAVATGGDLNVPGVLAQNTDGASTAAITHVDGNIPQSAGGISYTVSGGGGVYAGMPGASPAAGGGVGRADNGIWYGGTGGGGLVTIGYGVVE